MTSHGFAKRLLRRAGLAGAALALSGLAVLAAEDDTPRLLTVLGIRSATVAPNHAAFAALAYSNRRNLSGTYVNSPDSSAGIGGVMGDAGTGIGLQFGASFTGLNSGFGNSGHLSLQAGHLLQGSGVPTFVGLSVDRLAGWGAASAIAPAVSAMVTWFPTTRIGATRYPLMLTLGLGDHIRNDGQDPGGFAGIGIGLDPNFGISAAWTGDSVTIGGSYKADALKNWSFSAELDDAFNQNASRRVTISATILLENAFGG